MVRKVEDGEIGVSEQEHPVEPPERPPSGTDLVPPIRWLKNVILTTWDSSAALTLAEFLITILSLAAVYTFTNYSTPETFGTYQYYLTILGLLSIISLPGMKTSLTKYTAEGSHGLLDAAVGTRFRFSLLSSVASLGLAWYFWLVGQGALGVAFLATSVILPLHFSLDTVTPFFMGRQEFHTAAITKVASAGVPSVAVILLVLAFPSSAAPIIIGYVLSSAAILAIMWLWAKSLYGGSEEDDSAEEMSTYGKQLTARGVIGNVEQRLDLLIVGTFFTMEQLAVFSLGHLAREFLRKLWSVFQQQLLPKFAGKEETSRSLILRLIALTLLFFGLISGVIILFAPVVVPLVFSEVYTESVRYVQAFAGLTIIGVVGGVIETHFLAESVVKELFTLRLVTAGAYLLGLLLLVPTFGIIGILGALYIRAFTYTGVTFSLWTNEMPT